MKVTPDYLYILDVHWYLHRSFHVPMRPLSCPCTDCGGEESCLTCQGTGREPTKVPFLFTKMLKSLVEERKPAYFALCGDGPREALIRRSIYPDYKNRAGHAFDLAPQIRRSKQIIRALGLPYFELEGYEADDLIATLARDCVSDEVHVRIVSRDKDLMCLMEDDRIQLYDPIESCDVGPAFVQKRFGVKPAQMPDYLTLTGDTADGIPGVKGVGERTAVKLLTRYGSLRSILSHRSDLSARLQTLLADEKALRLSRSLVRLLHVDQLYPTAPLEFDGLDLSKAAPLFSLLGFRSWS